jgi:DNA-binding transcriptional ArsR family regulator
MRPYSAGSTIGNSQVTFCWVDVFAALADPVRRSLLEEVSSGPARVVDLAARRPISRPAVSKHLKVLVDAGLVTATDRGRERHYALDTEGLVPVSALLERLVLGGTPVSGQALDALATEVRRTARDRRTAPTSRQETA